MIIGFSGRIKSGKGMLSDYLINEHGFKKITVASVLKNSLSSLYSLDLDYFYSHTKKNENIALPWNKEVAKKYASILKENYTDLWYPGDTDCIFQNVREAMQFIGTQVLRRYDADYHIKKMVSSLDNGIDYVCDDIRFHNEKKFLEDYGGKCIYIIRPKNHSFSNHESEIDLNWTDFENVILNNEDFNDIKFCLNQFIKTNKIKNPIPVLQSYDYKCFLNINSYSAYAAGLIAGAGKVVQNGNKLLIEFTHPNNELVTYLKKYIKTTNMIWNNTLYIESSIICDNIKLWDIGIDHISFPSILLQHNNKKLAKNWFHGFVMSKATFIDDNAYITLQNDLAKTILSLTDFSTDVLQMYGNNDGTVQFVLDKMAF